MPVKLGVGALDAMVGVHALKQLAHGTLNPMNLFRSEGAVKARQTARMEGRAARTQQRGIRTGGRQWRGLFGTMSRGVTASRGGFRGMFGMVARGAVRLGTLVAGELTGGARVPAADRGYRHRGATTRRAGEDRCPPKRQLQPWRSRLGTTAALAARSRAAGCRRRIGYSCRRWRSLSRCARESRTEGRDRGEENCLRDWRTGPRQGRARLLRYRQEDPRGGRRGDGRRAAGPSRVPPIA